MFPSLYLAWRYLTFNKLRTAILIACVTLVGSLPLGLNTLLLASEKQLMARAETTPLIVGAKGSKLDLAIDALYFTTVPPEPISMADAKAIAKTNLALAIPLHTQFQARNFPIIGTTIDYFDFRNLTLAAGNSFGILGECVLGAEVARKLGLQPGDSLVSSPETVFDLGGSYPLKMQVVGILNATNTADDRAIFVDVKTAWVIQGLGHGHQDLTETTEEGTVLEREDNRVVASAKLKEYNEITRDNLAAFHFHGNTDTFPITAAIAIPKDSKSAAILRGRYELGDTPTQVVVPNQVVEELLLGIFKIRNILNLAFAVVALATAIAIFLIFNLSLRLRQQEIETSFRLGCSRGTIFRIVAAEIAVILIIGACFSAAIALGLSPFKDKITRTLISQAETPEINSRLLSQT